MLTFYRIFFFYLFKSHMSVTFVNHAFITALMYCFVHHAFITAAMYCFVHHAFITAPLFYLQMILKSVKHKLNPPE